MKNLFLTIQMCFIILPNFCMENDTIKSSKVKANIDLGIGLNVHRLKYYEHDNIDFNIRHKKTDYNFGIIPTLGSSLYYNGFKLKFDFIWLKMARINFGYDFGKLVNFPKNNKLFLSLNYSVIDYFSKPIYLYGLELTYQYKSLSSIIQFSNTEDLLR
jgi:hypothetical protein